VRKYLGKSSSAYCQPKNRKMKSSVKSVCYNALLQCFFNVHIVHYALKIIERLARNIQKIAN